MGDELEKARVVALKATAGPYSLLRGAFFGNAVPSVTKPDCSLVTDFDKVAEGHIIKAIQSEFPTHDILAEESGGKIGDGYTWLIDALDGTTNFVKKNPIFSIALTLLYRREPIFALVCCPILDDWYTGAKGKGAYLNGKPLCVSNVKSLSDALLGFNKGRKQEDFTRWYGAAKYLGGKARSIRMFGSSAYTICQIAAGRLDGEVNVGGSSWDTIGPALILKEAGGRATNFRGELISTETTDFLFTNGKIHNEALEALEVLTVPPGTVTLH
ncbi:MAG: inositol monophosphatase [Candidatus Spechtbacterales bacterium]